MPLTERQTSPSELGPENLDLSSFNGQLSYVAKVSPVLVVSVVM